MTASVGRRSTISSFAFCNSGGGSGLGSCAEDPTISRKPRLGVARPMLPVSGHLLGERLHLVVVQGQPESGRLDHREREHRLGALGGGEQAGHRSVGVTDEVRAVAEQLDDVGHVLGEIVVVCGWVGEVAPAVDHHQPPVVRQRPLLGPGISPFVTLPWTSRTSGPCSPRRRM